MRRGAAGLARALASAQGSGIALSALGSWSTFPVPGAHWLQPSGEQVVAGMGARAQS